MKKSRGEVVAYAWIAAFIAMACLGIGLWLEWKWLAWAAVVPGWSMVKLSLDVRGSDKRIKEEQESLLSDLAKSGKPATTN